MVCMLHLVILSFLFYISNFFVSNLNWFGFLFLFFFSVKSRKNNLPYDGIHTSAAHASLLYDVTDTDCWAQNGSAHSRVFMTLKHRFLPNRTKN